MRKSLIVYAFLLTAALSLTLFTTGGESTPVEKTKVSLFEPSIPKGPRKAGDCWTDSIAVLRPDAWRCMAGNEIYDPCFSRHDLKDAVVCGANPASGNAGFVLNLTKPLPKGSAKTSEQPRPWLVKLADGSTCEIQTGTIPFVASLTVPYGCSDSRECGEKGCPWMTGLTDEFEGGPAWMANKIIFSSSKNGFQLIKHVRLPVIAIWR